MPMLMFADNFLAGSLLTLLLPGGLVVAVAIWYVRTVRHIPKDTPRTAPALPTAEVLAAAVEAGIESAEGAEGAPPAGTS